MTTESDELITKLKIIRKEINSHILERTRATNVILLAFLSGQSVLFLGDVGTGKTSHIRLAAKLFGLSMFDILLSETTKPEHIFGPVDIPALAEGKQFTKIQGYAPSSEVLFLDEIFKANAIVLNPLLRLVYEHEYNNGDNGITQCPTKAVFAASNELPTDPSLRAIYDRLLMRCEVHYLTSHINLRKMVTASMGELPDINPLLSSKEVDQLREQVKAVKVPDEIIDTVVKIRDRIQVACRSNISDRRLAQSFNVMQAHALLKGRTEASVADVEVMANIFWEKSEQITKVQSIVLSHASSDIEDILSYAEMADSVWKKSVETGDMESAVTRLREMYQKVKSFGTTAGIEVARKIHNFLTQAKNTLEQRGNLILTKTENDRQQEIYKLSNASASLWTSDQLRRAGFRWKRKHQYWYTWDAGSQTLKRIKAALGVEPKVRKI